jgi:hypothetical protein
MAEGVVFDLYIFTDAAASAAISDVARSAWKAPGNNTYQ